LPREVDARWREDVTRVERVHAVRHGPGDPPERPLEEARVLRLDPELLAAESRDHGQDPDRERYGLVEQERSEALPYRSEPASPHTEPPQYGAKGRTRGQLLVRDDRGVVGFLVGGCGVDGPFHRTVPAAQRTRRPDPSDPRMEVVGNPLPIPSAGCHRPARHTRSQRRSVGGSSWFPSPSLPPSRDARPEAEETHPCRTTW